MTSEGKTYLDVATLDRLKRLDVRARLVVEGFIAGQHRSPYHGYAVEFATHREYAPGDDLRHIDWKVWSRSDRLYVKQYEEETNFACTIVLDASRSMQYGGPWRKYDYAATAAASLAYLLQQQQDAVGLAIVTDGLQKNLPPSSHASNLKLLVQALEHTEPEGKVDSSRALTELARQLGRRGVVVLISDLFWPAGVLADALKQFRLKRNEVIVFQVLHEDELTFPFRDDTLFRGLEDAVQLHAEPPALRKNYLAALARFLADVRKTCASAGVDHVLMSTEQKLDGVLGSYLALRQRVRRGLRRPAGS
ncbi:MAG TPA: DUF58 domain-containing protein [Pirellulaceae bacterium]|jgi:uncharacterized protein (DUF58 family)